jgi:hypothetical protein
MTFVRRNYLDQMKEHARENVDTALVHAQNMQTLLEELSDVIAIARAEGSSSLTSAAMRCCRSPLAARGQRSGALCV